MATLEDKILGEKSEYYCSSSSEDEANDSGNSDVDDENKLCINESQTSTSNCEMWDGKSRNTGPKGVIRDWESFEKSESERRKVQEQKRLESIKNLSITCRSTLEDEKEKLQKTDPDLVELLDGNFLFEYQQKRMKEMITKMSKIKFGNLIDLSNAEEFLNAIDKECKSVTVVIHIYENNIPACKTMNSSLTLIAQEYPHVKFCKIIGSSVGTSKFFKHKGVPALLAYKNGEMIGNFVRITDTLGDDFQPHDVEYFLLEHAIIADKIYNSFFLDNSNECEDSD